MALMDHLKDGEDVVARVGPFYATSRRVLRYEPAPQGKEPAPRGKEKEQLPELPYSRLSRIELVRPPNHPMMIGGTVMALGGLFLTFFVGLFTPMLAVPVGIGVIILGGTGAGKPRYFQLHSAGATKLEQALWRIPYHGSMDFIAAVGTRAGNKPIE